MPTPNLLRPSTKPSLPRLAGALALGLAAATVFQLPLPLPQAHAADWPNWRGPTFDGVSGESLSNPSTLKQKWKADVGTGFSSVSVINTTAYTAGWSDGQDRVQALNAETGKPLWSHAYKIDKFNIQHDGGSGGTPGVVKIGSDPSSKAVVTYMHRDGSVVGIDADTGKRLWLVALASKAGIDPPRWKFTGSVVPALPSDPAPASAYVDIGRIVKLNAKTGRVIWSSKNYKAAYATPVPFEHNGRQLVAAFPRFGLVILDAKTGKTVAEEAWETSYGVNAATPLVSSDGNQIFVSTGYGTGAALYNFDGKNLRSAWESSKMRNQFSSSVRVGEYLYGFDETTLRCLSWTDGSSTWNKRGLGRGSLCVVGDKLIIMAAKGELIIANADPTKFVALKTIQLFRGNDNWIVPIIAEGKIFARSSDGTLISLATQ